MDVPILKQQDFLIASIQSDLTDSDLTKLEMTLAQKVRQYRSRGVIIDVTVLEVMDSFAVRILGTIAQVTRLCGATTVIVGIQPAVAMSMVWMGLSLKNVETALDLEEGIELLQSLTRK